MAVPNGANRSLAGQVKEARRRFLDEGEVSLPTIATHMVDSWQRCREFGLVSDARNPGVPHASEAQLARARELQQTLLSHARPVMQFMSEQIRDSAGMVVLSDSRGMLLHAMGDDHFLDRAARVALRPGANWHEQWRGTNAIGTALHERQPIRVHGAEHYLERNAFLTCAAAPIVGPAGQLLGAIDISGDHRSYQSHTLGLVRSTARMIEHQLFDTRHAGGLRLRLHAQAEGIGTVVEGLLALSEDGWLIGANTAALEMLGLSASDIGGVTIERVLGQDLRSLMCGQSNRVGPPRQIRLDSQRSLWVQIDAPRTVFQARGLQAEDVAEPAPADRTGAPTTTPAAQTGPADALAALDMGDCAMRAAIARARKVINKPIALLLLGESGVGKELFARACHDSGERRGAPFVAVNCAALPETLIEAELFGYRPGAFTGAARDGAVGRIREAEGGTLFLDEIGDMPAPLQARLLRVLQEREVVPLGGGTPVAVDFQLICATHRRLRDDIAAGRFREDLYYRLNGLSLPLPPLRERSDLGALITAILARIAPEQPYQLAPAVAAAFATHHWPGNLRQLSNVLRTATALADGDLLDWSTLPADLTEEFEQAGPSGVNSGPGRGFDAGHNSGYDPGRPGPGQGAAGQTIERGPREAAASTWAGPPTELARGWPGKGLAMAPPGLSERGEPLPAGPQTPSANDPSCWPAEASAFGNAQRGLAQGSHGQGPFEATAPWPEQPPAGSRDEGGGLPTDLRRQADRCIEEAVRLCDGNLSAAARRLGVSRNTLYRRLRAMNAR